MVVVCILPVSKHMEDSDSILTDGVYEKTHKYFAGKLSRERNSLSSWNMLNRKKEQVHFMPLNLECCKVIVTPGLSDTFCYRQRG